MNVGDVFVLESATGIPTSGTFHEDRDCWVINREDQVRDIVAHPDRELEDDDDWESCGHCSQNGVGVQEDSDADEEREDVDDPFTILVPESANVATIREGLRAAAQELGGELNSSPGAPADGEIAYSDALAELSRAYTGWEAER